MINISPIPAQKLGNWKQIPIHESGEKLVALSHFADKMRLRIEPMYFRQGIFGAIPEIYVRESVFLKIEKALGIMPKNMELVIWDGWRPLATQQALFDVFKSRISTDMPNLSEEELLNRTSVYVSLPSSDPQKPSPHSTGGAVDLTVAYRGGDLLEMGTDYDDFSEKARTVFFELDNSVLTKSKIDWRENRRLLYAIMTEAGFTNYPEEWWHFDYGDQFWASISSSQHALYCNISPERNDSSDIF